MRYLHAMSGHAPGPLRPALSIGVAVLTNAVAPAEVNTAAVNVLEGLNARHS